MNILRRFYELLKIKNMAFKPEISYGHVLSEFSVNRKDPCEVIRELISNSYDAEASRIEIYSLPSSRNPGFIYFDNGCGMSETEEINEITPCKAFFSIGKSTKIFGDRIGYKCQGSKLCFACKKFTLITRCEKEKCWRIVSIDNPADNLNKDYTIELREELTPWIALKNLFPRSDKNVVNILKSLNEDFFHDRFVTGSMIIILGFKTEDFPSYYGTEGPNGKKESSYIRNYIRFNTRHGDIRILNAEKTGFPLNRAKSFPNTPSYNDKLELHLWVKDRLEEIEAGYPYLEKPDEQDLQRISTPAKVSKLQNGNFYARDATTFQWGEETYNLVLAIDGNRRAHQKYETLDRQGRKTRSGIRLTDQRGVFICSQGVKICQYNELFALSKLEKYEVLTTSKGQSHYVFMINGNFELVTDRNSLSENALTILKNESFVDHIKKFLDRFYNDNDVFKELIERLEGLKVEVNRNKYIEKLDKLKSGVKNRCRFMVRGIEQLEGKWLVEPIQGEEHWVGALYTLFAHLVPSKSPYAHIWLRPRNFSGVGIDSIAVEHDENSLKKDVHKGLEYKYVFSPREPFNHLLTVTNQIVCWEMPPP
jgi:hypothetical protein